MMTRMSEALATRIIYAFRVWWLSTKGVTALLYFYACTSYWSS